MRICSQLKTEQEKLKGIEDLMNSLVRIADDSNITTITFRILETTHNCVETTLLMIRQIIKNINILPHLT